MDKAEAISKGLYIQTGKEIDDAFMAELKKQIIHPEVIKEMGKELKIVYTPFNGTGNVPARRILKEIGFENVIVVPEQEMPDPNFTTLEYPNPEDPKAFTLALKLAKEVKADVVLATDPDADRLGIYALDTKTGEYVPFTGNMSGMLIAEYILRERTKLGLMPENPALVKTIVTMDLAEKRLKSLQDLNISASRLSGLKKEAHTIMYSALKRATAALPELMQETRMQSLRLCVFAKLQHIARSRVSPYGI